MNKELQRNKDEWAEEYVVRKYWQDNKREKKAYKGILKAGIGTRESIQIQLLTSPREKGESAKPTSDQSGHERPLESFRLFIRKKILTDLQKQE